MSPHADSEWYALYVELMETNPFCVTDDQLFSLFQALKKECWEEAAAPLPRWFCCDQPATRVMLAVQKHLKFEYEWEQFVRIMLNVLASDDQP